jgi:hypothetical protein
VATIVGSPDVQSLRFSTIVALFAAPAPPIAAVAGNREIGRSAINHEEQYGCSCRQQLLAMASEAALNSADCV